jgi:hypothetical protein
MPRLGHFYDLNKNQKKPMVDLESLQYMLKSYQKSLQAVRAQKKALVKTKKYQVQCEITQKWFVSELERAEKNYLEKIAEYNARINRLLKAK